MEIVTCVVEKIVELAVEHVGRQISYLCFMNDNIQKLESNIVMLKESRENVQRMVCDARRNAEDIKDGVQNWLAKVDAMIQRSEEILTNEGQQVRFCLNLVQRHQLSRKAVKMANEVLEMKNEGNFDRVSFSVAKYERSNFIKTTYDFLHFESRRLAKEQIMDALMDDNVQKIGIYGMGGVGKTMMVKEISREAMEKKLFDDVVTTTISQTQDLKRIQGELAERLGLKLEEDTIEGRALKLHKRLMTEKRSLIVFDDIWAPIDLEVIGIPRDVDHKGCKILFTSRDKHTLSNDMCIDKNFEIKILHDDEALNLFKRIVGETIEAMDFKPTVIQIVRECSNLPIAIITVAKALKNKSISVWMDALNQLRNPKAMNIRGMNDKVYASLKLSYEQLEREAKMLFLLCSMFPEDFEIDVKLLHIYAMAFDFLHGVDTVAKGRHRITKLVDDLISSSLLQNCEDKNDYVKMHDLVRDVAISIASKDDQIRTLSYGKNWNDWEADEASGNYTTVYLDFENYQNSPKKFMLPQVKLLILKGRYHFFRDLFEEMKDLQVLVLEGMIISFLPQSLRSFTNLRSLHMYHSELENIDMIGQFKKLEILSFEESNITKIPISISQLTQLKVLDLSHCDELEIIPPNVLSKLTKLEELKLETYSGWEREELYKERKNASLSELKSLSRLSTLCLCIKDEKVIPRQMFPLELKLEVFDISIGSPNKLCHHRQEIARKELYLKMESEYCMNDGIKMLLKRCEKLHLEGSFGAKIFLSGIDENGFSQLKHLDLLNICGLQHIIHSQKQPVGNVLSNLVHLCLKGLENLVRIIQGYDGKSPFNKLKFVEVEKCKKLTELFVNCSMDDLSNLEEIKIEECDMMKVIVVIANKGATNKFEFTHLKTLHLRGLAQLRNFSSKIEKGRASNFSNNDSFFSEEVSLPNLEKLKIKELDNLKMICGNILFPNSFSKLAEVCIDSCNNLEKVFSGRIMSILTSLKSISIRNCNLLEEIFEMQEFNVMKESVHLPSQLRELKLSNLPNLRYIWSEDPCELGAFENMETLFLFECPKLRKECVRNILPQLKHLETGLNIMKEIFEKKRSMEMLEVHQLNTFKAESLQSQDGLEKFCKLKILHLYGSLHHYQKAPSSMEILNIFPCLETFHVQNAFIETIFPNKRLVSMKEHQFTTTSDHLRQLSLFNLPELKHLWNEGSQNNTSLFLRHLISLSILECGILNLNFVPSSVSFRDLRCLNVLECHRLTHLLNPAVVKNLVQLDYLNIQACKRMSTVIDHIGGVEEGTEEIVFNKLQSLQLEKFPKLTSFHSGRCIIRFPRLNYVRIEDCPEMKVFSLGSVSTPQLNTKLIYVFNDEKRFYPKDSKSMIQEDINVIIQQNWEENFDGSIQDLFAEKNWEENQSVHSSSHVEEQ